MSDRLPDHDSAPPPSPSILSAQWLAVAGAVLGVTGVWYAGAAVLALGPALLVAILLAMVGVCCLVASLVLALRGGAVASPYAHTVERSLEGLARGHLGVDPEGVPADDPLGRVSSILRRGLVHLRSTLAPAQLAARESAQRAEDVATQIVGAHATAQRVAEQGAQVAEQATVATTNVDETRAELARLVGDVGALEGGARTAEGQLQQIGTIAGSTLVDLTRASEGLSGVHERLEAAVTELSGLENAVYDVREFVTLVRKMARQSKLLSLNAAMEAARAGEQGTGFGVVAAEVRRLAKSSSEAADRTERLLGDLLARTGAAEGAARDTLLLARGSRDAVERSRNELEDMAKGQLRDRRSAAHLSTAASAAAVASRLDQIATEIHALSVAARDARLAGSAQVARMQDLMASAHSLGRSAARTAVALEPLLTAPTAPVRGAGGAAPTLAPTRPATA